VAGRLADIYGRRRILLGVAILFAVTTAATGLAPTFTAFVVARFAGGLAVGTASLLSPMYVAEVSPARLRGRLSTLYQLSIVTGILVSFCVNYLLRDAGPENWRYMFMTGVIPSILFLVLLLRAPETPRFLLKTGQSAEALAILERIGGRESAESELEEIRASFQAKTGTWSDLLRPDVRRAVLVCFCLAILVHFSGINTIIDYAPSILRAAGCDSSRVPLVPTYEAEI
jgi:MFS family permease